MSVTWLKEILAIDGTALYELKIVYDGEWEQDGKWQTKETVVHLTDDPEFEDKEQWPVSSKLEPGFYQINDTRSGSYYSVS